VTPKNISDYLRAFYVMEVLYFLQVCLLKLSLLLFYLRIFPATRTRKIVWGTIIINVSYGAAFTLGGIFQCHPISYYWTSWDGLHQGRCLNLNGMAWANAIISILLDAWMLGFAISQVGCSLKKYVLVDTYELQQGYTSPNALEEKARCGFDVLGWNFVSNCHSQSEGSCADHL